MAHECLAHAGWDVPSMAEPIFRPRTAMAAPDFPTFSAQIARLWREDRERVQGEAARVMEALAETGRGAEREQFKRDETPLRRGFESFSRSF